jgi:hypothetical protein
MAKQTKKIAKGSGTAQKQKSSTSGAKAKTPAALIGTTKGNAPHHDQDEDIFYGS